MLMKSMQCIKAAINGTGQEIKINSLKDHGNIKLKGQTNYGYLFQYLLWQKCFISICNITLLIFISLCHFFSLILYLLKYLT